MRRLPAVAVLAAAAVAATGTGALLLRTPPRAPAHEDGTVPAATAPAEDSGSAGDRAGDGAGDGAGDRAGIPVGLTVGGTRVAVVPAGTGADGRLALPASPGTLAWWPGGGWPGARRGSVVIAGHVDTARGGPGALAGLADLPLGSSVTVHDDTGAAYRYLLRARRAYPKGRLPAEVFRAGGPPRLVLVTCGGRFDPERHAYADNVVGYAVPDR